MQNAIDWQSRHGAYKRVAHNSFAHHSGIGNLSLLKPVIAADSSKVNKDIRTEKPLLTRSFLEDEQSGFFKLADNTDNCGRLVTESSEQDNHTQRHKVQALLKKSRLLMDLRK